MPPRKPLQEAPKGSSAPAAENGSEELEDSSLESDDETIADYDCLFINTTRLEFPSVLQKLQNNRYTFPEIRVKIINESRCPKEELKEFRERLRSLKQRARLVLESDKPNKRNDFAEYSLCGDFDLPVGLSERSDGLCDNSHAWPIERWLGPCQHHHYMGLGQRFLDHHWDVDGHCNFGVCDHCQELTYRHGDPVTEQPLEDLGNDAFRKAYPNADQSDEEAPAKEERRARAKADAQERDVWEERRANCEELVLRENHSEDLDYYRKNPIDFHRVMLGRVEEEVIARGFDKRENVEQRMLESWLAFYQGQIDEAEREHEERCDRYSDYQADPNGDGDRGSKGDESSRDDEDDNHGPSPARGKVKNKQDGQAAKRQQSERGKNQERPSRDQSEHQRVQAARLRYLEMGPQYDNLTLSEIAAAESEREHRERAVLRSLKKIHVVGYDRTTAFARMMLEITNDFIRNGPRAEHSEQSRLWTRLWRRWYRDRLFGGSRPIRRNMIYEESVQHEEILHTIETRPHYDSLSPSQRATAEHMRHTYEDNAMYHRGPAVGDVDRQDRSSTDFAQMMLEVILEDMADPEIKRYSDLEGRWLKHWCIYYSARYEDGSKAIPEVADDENSIQQRLESREKQKTHCEEGRQHGKSHSKADAAEQETDPRPRSEKEKNRMYFNTAQSVQDYTIEQTLLSRNQPSPPLIQPGREHYAHLRLREREKQRENENAYRLQTMGEGYADERAEEHNAEMRARRALEDRVLQNLLDRELHNLRVRNVAQINRDNSPSLARIMVDWINGTLDGPEYQMLGPHEQRWRWRWRSEYQARVDEHQKEQAAKKTPHKSRQPRVNRSGETGPSRLLGAPRPHARGPRHVSIALTTSDPNEQPAKKSGGSFQPRRRRSPRNSDQSSQLQQAIYQSFFRGQPDRFSDRNAETTAAEPSGQQQSLSHQAESTSMEKCKQPAHESREDVDPEQQCTIYHQAQMNADEGGHEIEDWDSSAEAAQYERSCYRHEARKHGINIRESSEERKHLHQSSDEGEFHFSDFEDDIGDVPITRQTSREVNTANDGIDGEGMAAGEIENEIRAGEGATEGEKAKRMGGMNKAGQKNAAESNAPKKSHDDSPASSHTSIPCSQNSSVSRLPRQSRRTEGKPSSADNETTGGEPGSHAEAPRDVRSPSSSPESRSLPPTKRKASDPPPGHPPLKKKKSPQPNDPNPGKNRFEVPSFTSSESINSTRPDTSNSIQYIINDTNPAEMPQGKQIEIVNIPQEEVEGRTEAKDKGQQSRGKPRGKQRKAHGKKRKGGRKRGPGGRFVKGESGGSVGGGGNDGDSSSGSESSLGNGRPFGNEDGGGDGDNPGPRIRPAIEQRSWRREARMRRLQRKHNAPFLDQIFRGELEPRGLIPHSRGGSYEHWIRYAWTDVCDRCHVEGLSLYPEGRLWCDCMDERAREPWLCNHCDEANCGMLLGESIAGRELSHIHIIKDGLLTHDEDLERPKRKGELEPPPRCLCSKVTTLRRDQRCWFKDRDGLMKRVHPKKLVKRCTICLGFVVPKPDKPERESIRLKKNEQNHILKEEEEVASKHDDNIGKSSRKIMGEGGLVMLGQERNRLMRINNHGFEDTLYTPDDPDAPGKRQKKRRVPRPLRKLTRQEGDAEAPEGLYNRKDGDYFLTAKGRDYWYNKARQAPFKKWYEGREDLDTDSDEDEYVDELEYVDVDEYSDEEDNIDLVLTERKKKRKTILARIERGRQLLVRRWDHERNRQRQRGVEGLTERQEMITEDLQKLREWRRVLIRDGERDSSKPQKRKWLKKSIGGLKLFLLQLRVAEELDPGERRRLAERLQKRRRRAEEAERIEHEERGFTRAERERRQKIRDIDKATRKIDKEDRRERARKGELDAEENEESSSDSSSDSDGDDQSNMHRVVSQPRERSDEDPAIPSNIEQVGEAQEENLRQRKQDQQRQTHQRQSQRSQPDAVQRLLDEMMDELQERIPEIQAGVPQGENWDDFGAIGVEGEQLDEQTEEDDDEVNNDSDDGNDDGDAQGASSTGSGRDLQTVGDEEDNAISIGSSKSASEES